MKKDLQSRLNELAWNITSIGNFNYAPQYGYKIADIQSLAERVADEFPGVYEVISSAYPIVDVINLKGVASVDFNKISKWEKEVGKILIRLRKDPSYRALLKAYNEDNQIEIAEILPNVFVNLGTQNLLEPGQKAPLLFHGITVPRSIGAQEYLDLCLKIQREGIKPSPYGLHMDMDSQIRPIFLTPKPYNAHGLIALSFKPDSHAVVVEKNDYEAKIYSKKLNANFELALRDADTLFSHGPDNDAGVPKNRAEEYVKSLAGLLNERKIPFKRISLCSD